MVEEIEDFTLITPHSIECWWEACGWKDITVLDSLYGSLHDLMIKRTSKMKIHNKKLDLAKVVIQFTNNHSWVLTLMSSEQVEIRNYEGKLWLTSS